MNSEMADFIKSQTVLAKAVVGGRAANQDRDLRDLPDRDTGGPTLDPIGLLHGPDPREPIRTPRIYD